MSEKFIDLLSIDRGVVTAPAGCGKTHLISEAVQRHTESKPILVLTHTNAGVAALRGRFNKAGVSVKSYKLSTLDGFAMRLVGCFPNRSGLGSDVLKLEYPKTDYPAIKKAACKLLIEGHLQEIIVASYSRLIVDEYQDCCTTQHCFVANIAAVLPTCILGDPLQAVFTWLGLPDWDSEVCKTFPVADELTTPWRWRNARTEEFGRWLLHIRKQLIASEPVNFSDSPEEVSWIDLSTADNCHACQLAAARTKAPSPNGSVLIIGNGKYPPAQRRIASQVPGAVTIENVNLDDLIDFAQCFDFSAPDALSRLVDFAGKVMRNVGADHLLKRIDSLESGRARNPASDTEKAALYFKATPSPSTAVNFLVELNKTVGVSSHRPSVLRACIKSLNACSCSKSSLYEAAINAREHYRLLGRTLPGRAVGSTLLLKGLEADVSVILNAADHDTNSLYVAMTRGSKKLTICAYSQLWPL